jgi:hypothetical protein
MFHIPLVFMFPLFGISSKLTIFAHNQQLIFWINFLL